MLHNGLDTLILLNLFDRFSACWIRSMCSPLTDLADVTTVAHAFRFLNADDPFVARVARSALVLAVRRKIRRGPNSEDIACYLSGSVDGDMALHSTSRASFWLRVRAAAARTVKKIRYRWRWDSGRAELSLECPSRPRSEGDRTSGRQTASHWPNAICDVGALYVRASRKAGPGEGGGVDLPSWSE